MWSQNFISLSLSSMACFGSPIVIWKIYIFSFDLGFSVSTLHVKNSFLHALPRIITNCEEFTCII